MTSESANPLFSAQSGILFRADASIEIGTGHAMRCATLAAVLQQQGLPITFACRSLPGHLNDWLRQKGYKVLSWQSEDPAFFPTLLADSSPNGVSNQKAHWDCLVVDHYGLDANWERQMRSHCHRILALDDLANRPHDCDWLLDQNDLQNDKTRYQPWVTQDCDLLLGPQYALLRPDFLEYRAGEQRMARKDAPSAEYPRMLVCFGGSDPTGETLKTLTALQKLAFPCQIEVIAGAANPRQDAIRQACARMRNTVFYGQVENMAERMAWADLSIGAGGTTTWERLCLGLPSIVIAVAENQVEISRAVAQVDAQLFLGSSSTVTEALIQTAVQTLWNDLPRRTRMSENAMKLVDGRGTSRVAEKILASRFITS